MPRKIFNLESSLYSEVIIHRAIEDFGSDFDISFSDGALSIAAESDTEIDEIFEEFMNYVLSLENA